MTAATVARGGAIAIAALAAIDPSFTRARTVPVPISLVHDGRSASLASELRRELAGEFELVDGVSPSAEATVLIRASHGPLPPVPERGRVFVIDDPSRASAIGIRSIDAPRQALAGRAAAITIVIDVHEALEAPLRIELRAGDRLVASDERASAQRGSLDVRVSFVPAAQGLVPLHVTATSGDSRVEAGAVVNVADRKLRVLFSDPQPSWASTFVRRALEQDAAFEVSAQTVTSRGVSVSAGGQSSFESPAARESIDVVVAGTPSRASAGTMRALETFARERGGAVVLLADEDAGRAYEQITGARWRTRTLAQPAMASGGHGTFLFSRALVPETPLLTAGTLARTDRAPEAIVHDVPAGHGRFIISGALDAWRHRATPGSGFSAFWRGVIADAALAAAPAATIAISPRRADPGAIVTAEVVLRNVAPDEMVSIGAVLEQDGRATPVRMWPAPAAGVFTARFAAPAAEGTAVLKVTGSAAGRTVQGEGAFLVSKTEPLSNVSASVPIVLISAREGAYIPGGGPQNLRNDLRLAFPEHTAPVAAHPMRYAWWIAPFTLLLGFEWRWRRTRGLK